jgi:hypothetical protein
VINDNIWSAMATLIAAVLATIAAAAAIENSRYQIEEDKEEILKMLGYESIEIIERVIEMRKNIEENTPTIHNLYIPLGWGDVKLLMRIKPEYSAKIADMRRFLKKYKKRGYVKDDERGITEETGIEKFNKHKKQTKKKSLVTEFDEFISNWKDTFGDPQSVREEINS